MMRIDTKATYLDDMILLANEFVAIKFLYTDQYLSYKQVDFTFHKALAYTNMKTLTPVENGD